MSNIILTYLLTYLVPRRCSSKQRQLLHESSPCSSILTGTSSVLYGKIQQSTVFFQTVDPSPFWSFFAALSINVSFHCYLNWPFLKYVRSTVVFFAKFCELCRGCIRACSESLCSSSCPILLRLQLFSDTPFQTL